MAPSISKPANSSSSAKPNLLFESSSMIKSLFINFVVTLGVCPAFVEWCETTVGRRFRCPTMFKFGRFVLQGRCTSTNNVSAAATAIVSRYDSTSAIMYTRQRCIIRRVYPNGFHCNIGSNELIIPQFNRCASSTRRSDPVMRQCNTAEELVQLAYDHLDTISPRVIAAFWSSLAKLVQNQRGGNSRVQLNKQLDAILDSTMESIGQFSGRDLATLALGLAKVMKQVESHGQRAAAGSLHRRLHTLLVGINYENKHYIFSEIAVHAIPILSEFDARHLSNLIYSFNFAEYVPKVEDGRTILDVVALEAISKLKHFNSQDLSNMLWSYAKMESSNSVLFKAAGDTIVDMNDVGEFKPQELSNIIWAYATAGESHPKLYRKFGDHIVGMNDLNRFDPQALSNIIWSYATAGKSHPQLYCKLGDHIVAMRDLNAFKPQDFSNIIWSYATAGQTHPKLYKKLAVHIALLDDLGQFKPQHLSNILWSFVTAGESHPLLFQKMADVAIARSTDFNSQGIANLLWAYASVGIIDQHLFTTFAPVVKSVFGHCSSQALANIAWSYAVANVNDHSIFNTDFVAALQAKADDFVPANLSQLHQWQLWQDELKSGINLPPALREKCRQVFVSESYQSSRLQDDVISVLSSSGMLPEEEVLTLSGYRLDAHVEVNGTKLGIEVDGPSHFINREATGSTLLKRRQVSTLDGIRIVSVPYWEWNECGNDSTKKQDYLLSRLGLS